MSDKQTLGFETEISQLLKLMINSIYSNKEIFLRELISNGSDALEKLRFEALQDGSLMEDDAELSIRVDFDKEAKTITITDKGIGMSREEVQNNIGTIAQSGTRQFIEALSGEKANDSQLIGQFGVGFYSAFLIADKVTINTRRAGLPKDEGVSWTSAGESEYTIETITREANGTEIILHVSEGNEEFIDSFRLRGIIKKFSDHLSFPLIMQKDPEPVSSEDDEKDETIIDVPEDEVVNQATALWTRSKSEISDDEYKEFYKHVSHDFEDPLKWVHSRVEGKTEYTSLLYIPNRAPFDLWDRDRKNGIKLYVKRIFIMDDAEHLLPSYLRFVRGIVDTSDLPLNVSREILQKNKVIDSIRAASVKKVLGMIEGIAKGEDNEYANFWEKFGNVLKEGLAEDFSNKERLSKLIRFSTTHTDSKEQNVSLDDYIARMKDDQEKIYYVTADTFAAAKNSPHLEALRAKGIEVILFHDRVDEWMLSMLNDFDGKPLVSVAKGDLDLGAMENEEEKKEQEKTEAEFEELLKRMKETLGDKVDEVKVTNRLTQSPACLVSNAHGMSANLERMLQQAGQEMPSSKQTLEINPEHLLIKRISDEQDDERFADWTSLLFDQALLSEGGTLEDPAGFVHKLNGMLIELAG